MIFLLWMGQSFIEKTNMTSYMNIYFSCNLCHKPFVQKLYLTIHKYFPIWKCIHWQGMERQCQDVAKRIQAQFTEYWPFLDAHVDLHSEEGLQRLEHYLTNMQQVICLIYVAVLWFIWISWIFNLD